MTTSTGCAPNKPFYQTELNAHGDVVILDTVDNWIFFCITVDQQVSDERRGLKPPGVQSWNEHWVRRISERKKHGNPDKYIAYIIKARRRADLPELEGYSP